MKKDKIFFAVRWGMRCGRYAGALACFALIRRLRRHLPHPGEGFWGGAWLFMRYLFASEIPPAGAPLGAGFDCAAMIGECA